jgi:hypothetical protein
MRSCDLGETRWIAKTAMHGVSPVQGLGMRYCKEHVNGPNWAEESSVEWAARIYLTETVGEMLAADGRELSEPAVQRYLVEETNALTNAFCRACEDFMAYDFRGPPERTAT